MNLHCPLLEQVGLETREDDAIELLSSAEDALFEAYGTLRDARMCLRHAALKRRTKVTA